MFSCTFLARPRASSGEMQALVASRYRVWKRAREAARIKTLDRVPWMKQHLRKWVTAASQFARSRKDARSGPGFRDVQTKYLVTQVYVVRRPASGVVEIVETVGQIPFRVFLFPVPRSHFPVSSIHIPSYLPPPLPNPRASCRPDRSLESANPSMPSQSLLLFEKRPWEEGENSADDRKGNGYSKHSVYISPFEP